MPRLHRLSASEQAAAHLRAEMEQGRWTGLMPGVNQLAPELGVTRKTVEAAMRQLEHEGLLVPQGKGRRRLIVLPAGSSVRPMRVGILLHEFADRFLPYVVELQHALIEAGHSAIIATESLTELNMDIRRIARRVRQTAADAWVILAGSREVLEWFSAQPVPTFALFGRREGLPIAATGPDKSPSISAATHRLLGLGHRRIVMIARRARRLPQPGKGERAYLDALRAHGLPVSEFNLPDWQETREGLQALLSLLFRITPPTAMIVDEVALFTAVQQFLAGRGLRVPQHVSLICTDADPVFSWCLPSVAHIRWDAGPVVRRIVRWAASVSHGKRNIRQTLTPAEFVEGGTLGPAPRG